jgi:hypothetical protein
MRLIGIVMVVAALSIAPITVADAADRKALPAFALSAVDGTSVETSALAVDATWLFVYVQAHCSPCDALLARIGSDERTSASRIVIVGAGMDTGAMNALAAKYPNLQPSRWLADPERAAAAPLGVQAMPTVFGLRASSIEWRLAGTGAAIRNSTRFCSPGWRSDDEPYPRTGAGPARQRVAGSRAGAAGIHRHGAERRAGRLGGRADAGAVDPRLRRS